MQKYIFVAKMHLGGNVAKKHENCRLEKKHTWSQVGLLLYIIFSSRRIRLTLWIAAFIHWQLCFSCKYILQQLLQGVQRQTFMFWFDLTDRRMELFSKNQSILGSWEVEIYARSIISDFFNIRRPQQQFEIQAAF